MIKIIKHALNKNAWLFLAAAWVYTLSFIFTNYFSYSSSAQKVANIISEYIQTQEKSFQNILHDTATLNAIINDEPSLQKQQLLTDAQGIFAYQVNDIGNPVEIFWNTNKMSVAPEDLLKPDGGYLVNYQNGSFDLLKSSITKQGIEYFFITLIPVRWQYFMQNEYLQTHFAVSETISNDFEVAPPNEGAAVINAAGNTLFSITETNPSYNDAPVGFSVFLRVIALLCLFIFINNVASAVVKEKNFKSGFALLVASFLMLRIIIFLFRFPFNYQITPLFNAAVYHGGYINKSLGDLLLNAITVLWVILFFRKKIKPATLSSVKSLDGVYNVLIYLSVLILPLISFYITDVISGLVTRSTISFDAADFFSLSIFSLAGFIIICMLLYIWLYVTGFFVQLLEKIKLPFFWQNILVVTCSFLLISLHIFFADAKLLLIVTGFIVLLIFFMRYRDNPSFSSLVNSSYFIAWALILTALASALVVYQNNIKEQQSRLNIAKGMQQQTDSSGTFLVRLALNNFSDNFLQHNFYRFKNTGDSRFIKDSLIKKNLTAYLTKYITKIYVFDKNNQPLNNDDSTSYDVINSVLENRSKPTGVPGLYFYRNKPDAYNYIYARKVVKDSVYLGALFVLVQPRLYESSALVPELFKQTSDIASLTENGYVFGMYDNRKLVSAFTGFNFSDSVNTNQIPTTGYYFKDSVGYNELWYNAGSGKLLVIVKRNNWFFNFITLFSYLFVLFIFLAFAVHTSRNQLNNPDRKFSFKNLFRFNIRTQIQTTIVGVSIASFLIIGVATISFFILRFKNGTTNQLINTSQVISNEIQQALKFEIVTGDILNINDATANNDFEKKIVDIATIHNADVNLYAKNGSLLVSSQPYIYTQDILSNRMDPEAFRQLHYNKSTRFIQTEQIGNFSFQSIYTPVKDEKDETIAYLNVPLLSAQNELKEEISDFLVTLIILNALIFIFAGAIAVTLTGRITTSLELIGGKMKEIKIGSTNEEIAWKGHDEIGMLVDEYNKMVKQLGQSAEALARSEREGAWREMAKQVAHEIKNPLTPMKLSIQYLQKSMEENTPNAVELSKKLASTLIEQIDQLSKIAGDFSQFANIENIHPERFDLTELIQNLVNLYQTDERLSINYINANNNVEIFSDKAQINRLFTNLIKNAIEASDENQIARIQIKQLAQDKNVIISVTDCGNGINESLRSKIFDPNFTTKTSGTGLGLAICKAIVEKAGGKVWFATTPGEGTTFYVNLLLAN
ncbi:MAG: HAMP domain-containing sensor histidine kinase [Parafilimonas sp.]